MPNVYLPTEYEEQCALVDYLELKGLLFSKTAQETFTRSWGQKMKNQRSGLRKGLPDMFIFISADKSKSGLPILACVEMKRTKGGVTSSEQKEWVDSLNSVSGVSAVVAKGFEEARKFVDSYLK
jgi:hypothetical protein